MSNPEKKWSWGGAMGRATGSGLTGVAGGALAGHLGGPLGVPVGAAILGAFGFAGGFIGAALGHWWDQLDRPREEFGSGALFTLVVSGVLNLTFVLLAAPSFSKASDATAALYILVCGGSLMSSASKSLLDDLHATYVISRERERY
jgi:hypothetical protein